MRKTNSQTTKYKCKPDLTIWQPKPCAMGKGIRRKVNQRGWAEEKGPIPCLIFQKTGGSLKG